MISESVNGSVKARKLGTATSEHLSVDTFCLWSICKKYKKNDEWQGGAVQCGKSILE